MLRDNKIDEEALKTYFRKRRRMISDDNYLPVAKRRRILDNLGGKRKGNYVVYLHFTCGVLVCVLIVVLVLICRKRTFSCIGFA